MSITDILLIAVLIWLSVYGSFANLKRILFLLVSVLLAFLMILLFLSPIEHLIMSSIGINPTDFYGAPAVAVLILEGYNIHAFLAALIPLFLFIIIMIMYILLDLFIIKKAVEYDKAGVFGRIIGFLSGSLSGFVLILMFALQLLRLPWPPAAGVFEKSYILSLFGYFSSFFIPLLSGIS